MSEADDEISEALWTLARDPKYAEIADTLAEAAGHIVSLNAIIDVEIPERRRERGPDVRRIGPPTERKPLEFDYDQPF
jgi:hypothetical protein